MVTLINVSIMRCDILFYTSHWEEIPNIYSTDRLPDNTMHASAVV